MSDPFEDERNVSIGTADHLADLESRYDTHMLALRKHAAELQAAAARPAGTLAEPPARDSTADPDPADP